MPETSLYRYHILGAGNPLRQRNYSSRARLKTVLSMPATATAVLYGRLQPGMHTSEAELGAEYLKLKGFTDTARLVLNMLPKSTAETVALIVSDMHGSFWHNKTRLLNGEPEIRHLIVTNWPHMPRTRYLLKKHWRHAYPDIPWQVVRRMVIFRPVGDTFLPYWKKHRLRAVLHWLANPLAYEILEWVKALRDPFDRRLNQKRDMSHRLSNLFLK